MESELLSKFTKFEISVDSNSRRLIIPCEIIHLFPTLLDGLLNYCDARDKTDLTEICFEFDQVDGKTMKMMIEYAKLYQSEGSEEEFHEMLEKNIKKTAKMVQGFHSLHCTLLTMHVGVNLRKNHSSVMMARLFGMSICSSLIRFFFVWPLKYRRDVEG